MFGIRFINVQPGTYQLPYQNGEIVREGTGVSFFYYARTTSLVAIPTGSLVFDWKSCRAGCLRGTIKQGGVMTKATTSLKASASYLHRQACACSPSILVTNVAHGLR